MQTWINNLVIWMELSTLAPKKTAGELIAISPRMIQYQKT